MTTIQLDGDQMGRRISRDSLSGWISTGHPDEWGYYREHFQQRSLIEELHQSENLLIERQLIRLLKGQLDQEAEIDELVVWLKTSAVSIQDGTTLLLEVDGQKFEIKSSSPAQRLVLQFEDREVPEGIGEGITRPLRLDGHATYSDELEKTALENLYLYGTAQFRARALQHLALFDDFPGLRNLVDKAQKRHEQVPIMVIMQLCSGAPRFGPGYPFMELPAEFDGVLATRRNKAPTIHTNVLYDPYTAEAVDALFALTRTLQKAYESLSAANTGEVPKGE